MNTKQKKKLQTDVREVQQLLRTARASLDEAAGKLDESFMAKGLSDEDRSSPVRDSERILEELWSDLHTTDRKLTRLLARMEYLDA